MRQGSPPNYNIFNDVGKLITFQEHKYCLRNRPDPFAARLRGPD